jgi:hypothetical protein
MRRAKMRTSSEWARLEEEMRSSGMTQKAWCEANGINLGSIRNSIKRRKTRKEQITSHNETGIPVKWIEAILAVSKDTASNTAPAVIEVMTGRYVIKVSAGFDRMTFIDICEALAAL